MSARVVVACLLAGALLSSACGGGDAPPTTLRPTILDVRATTPMLVGTRLRLLATEVDMLGPTRTLIVEGSAGRFDLREASSATLAFPLDAALVRAFGLGTHDVDLRLAGDGVESEPYPYVLSIADAPTLALTTGPSGDVHRNELVVLEGDGFLEPDEGELVLRVQGELRVDGGATRAVDARLPASLAEYGSRSRGLVRLTTALGGPEPGMLEGTAHLEATLPGGATSRSETRPIRVRFLPPEVFAIEPAVVSLEQLVRVRGAGFLGGGDEVTILRAEGSFTPEGAPPSAVPPAELVLEWIDGETLVGAIRAVPLGEALVSELFGAQRGRFAGTLTPVTLAGRVEVAGSPAPITLTLGPVRQVVWLRFLPGFYDSLALFGLAAGAGTIERLVQERIESIYAGFRVEVRLERPTDFGPAGFSVVEIGGPDPNGRGLFGYDNSPGKDIGNLRLFDAIGGANAETQADGYPGYGGVFVESLFAFSAHPPAALGGVGPTSDPLFDEIFDGVRDRPATLAEVRGEGARAAEVDRALRALASIIGETTAHELGHSFGLAEPYGSPTVFHNPGDQPGCLMDSGSARPLGERAAQPGYPATRLCRDAPSYMELILGD
ncbi:MAG: hypothetical protein KF901_24270 [Myxococcales bacterium]|nr:hypothetical protein [Myxococcales bacterium]